MNKTVRIYYAGIPAKNKNEEKKLVLKNFHIGVPDNQSTEILNFDYQLSDLAVIQGWVHKDSGHASHLQFRKKIIENQSKNNKHTLAIDSNLFLYKDNTNSKNYLRFSLNGVFPTTGYYFHKNVDPNRWLKIKKDLSIDLKPWVKHGKHILVCLQRNGGWSMGGLDVMHWCNSTIEKIKQFSNRLIVVRAHPGDKKVKNYLKLNYPNVIISKNQNILTDFENAWCTITYNSSPGVASVIEGIPTFVTDPIPEHSQAFDVANVDLKNIETPLKFDRQLWIEKISMSHWNFDDLKKGNLWKYVKDSI